MTTQKIIILLLTTCLFCTVIFGQTKSDIFSLYKDKAKAITSDSTFQKIAFSNEHYGSLTGYFRRDSIYVIVEHYKHHYGVSECVFLFDRDKLIFVNKKQINTKHLDSTGISADTITDIKFEALYLLLNDEIIQEQVDGQENEREFDAGDPYPYKTNSAKYFLFLAKKDKTMLLQKKSGS